MIHIQSKFSNIILINKFNLILVYFQWVIKF